MKNKTLKDIDTEMLVLGVIIFIIGIFLFFISFNTMNAIQTQIGIGLLIFCVFMIIVRVFTKNWSIRKSASLLFLLLVMIMTIIAFLYFFVDEKHCSIDADCVFKPIYGGQICVNILYTPRLSSSDVIIETEFLPPEAKCGCIDNTCTRYNYCETDEECNYDPRYDFIAEEYRRICINNTCILKEE